MRCLLQVQRLPPSLPVMQHSSQGILPGERLVGDCQGFLPVGCSIGSESELR